MTKELLEQYPDICAEIKELERHMKCMEKEDTIEIEENKEEQHETV